MIDKYKYSTSQLLNFTQDSYLERSSRPVTAIVFLLPFIIAYELGTIFINTDILRQSQVRVVAFVWLQDFLSYLGLCTKLAWMAPPLVVVIILASLQLASRKKWLFEFRLFGPMLIECIFLAIPLIVLGILFNNYNSHLPSSAFSISSGFVSVCAAAGEIVTRPSLMADIITGIGAGIYEELIFRLILICVLMIFFQDILRLNHKHAIIASIIISAAMFSAHHHILFMNGQIEMSSPFTMPEFLFRTTAGVYFAILFAVRGFGITAGTHGLYDIIATLINAMFFYH